MNCAHPRCSRTGDTQRSDPVNGKIVWVCRDHEEWWNNRVYEVTERKKERERNRKADKAAQEALAIGDGSHGLEPADRGGRGKQREYLYDKIKRMKER